MNLKNLSDHELWTKTETAAREERAATTLLLHHLAEVGRRRLFAKRGFSSLFEYCVKALAMSEPQAARRVNGARLLADFPEIEAPLQSGDLKLTNISQAQVFFRKEKIVSQERKREVLQKLMHQSTRETEKILIAESSAPKAGGDCIKSKNQRRNDERSRAAA